MAIKLEDIKRVVFSPAIIALLVVALLSLLAILVVGSFVQKTQIPTILVVFLIGVLMGVLLPTFFPEFKFELERMNPIVLILGGAVLFSLLGTLFSLYSSTVQQYAIVGSMPLAVVTITELLSKLASAFVTNFIHGILVFLGTILGSRLSK